MTQKNVDLDKIQQRLSDPEYQKKRLFWGNKWWKKKSFEKNSIYALGALSIVGKDRQGRKIILPTGYLENTGISIKHVSISNEITSDFMGEVNNRLFPLRFTGKITKHKF